VFCSHDELEHFFKIVLAEFSFISTGLQAGDSWSPGRFSRFSGFGKDGKPLKRLLSALQTHTGLKPGVNEMAVLKANSILSSYRILPVDRATVH